MDQIWAEFAHYSARRVVCCSSCRPCRGGRQRREAAGATLRNGELTNERGDQREKRDKFEQYMQTYYQPCISLRPTEADPAAAEAEGT